MAGHGELVEPEGRHHLHLVLCHGALGVPGMVGATLGSSAVAVATQVGTHHGEVVGEQRCDPVPHGHGLGESMQQQQWRTGARHCHRDIRAGDRDL